jgi:hypothetical protein
MEGPRIGVWLRIVALCIVLGMWVVGAMGCEKRLSVERHIELHEQVHEQIVPEE